MEVRITLQDWEVKHIVRAFRRMQGSLDYYERDPLRIAGAHMWAQLCKAYDARKEKLERWERVH